MTDNKVMAWLKDKEKHIKNKSENHMYAYGVTLGVSDLPYINRLKHILSAKRGMKIAKHAVGGVMAGDNFCPSCGSYLGKYYLPNYCSDCGQKIEQEGGSK